MGVDGMGVDGMGVDGVGVDGMEGKREREREKPKLEREAKSNRRKDLVLHGLVARKVRRRCV